MAQARQTVAAQTGGMKGVRNALLWEEGGRVPGWMVCLRAPVSGASTCTQPPLVPAARMGSPAQPPHVSASPSFRPAAGLSEADLVHELHHSGIAGALASGCVMQRRRWSMLATALDMATETPRGLRGLCL